MKIALSARAQIGNPGFERYHFEHDALPEIDFDQIDLTTTFLGKKINYPFFISCMTGGVEKGAIINANLARAAEKHHIPLGVGSCRAAIEHPELQKLFTVRQYAPTIPVLANIGLVQLNYGFNLSKLQQVIEMVQADALVFHLNPLQEVLQPEGNRNFGQLLIKLERIIPQLSVPIIIKEVGCGLSEKVISQLYDIGVRIFDTAGWGGTNWAYIESHRRHGWQEIGKLFGQWGVPTIDSILAAQKIRKEKKAKDMIILGSGGVRTGLDIAKALALGADLAGLALPFLQAALTSEKAVEKLINRLAYELKITMFGVGVKNINDMRRYKLISLAQI